MRSFIAAGFDPAHFWKLTPRMYQIYMLGASDRAERELASVWWSAMMPYLKRPPTFQEFTGVKPDKRADLRACIAAWDKIDASLRRNKRTT